MSKTPAREQAQVNIRIPDDLRELIKAAAARNNRSMNAEITHVLSAAYFYIDESSPDLNAIPDYEGDYDPSDYPNAAQRSPEMQAAMREMVEKIKADTERRFVEWLWGPGEYELFDYPHTDTTAAIKTLQSEHSAAAKKLKDKLFPNSSSREE